MRRKILLPLILIATLLGCKNNQWDEHINPLDGVAQQNLLELLKSDAQLSVFAGMVEQSGWGLQMQSTQVYTVWAPRNTTMAQVGSEITGNPEKLKEFIANHITSDYSLAAGNSEVKLVKMAGGKNLLVNNALKTIDGVKLADPLDIPATNGMLHVVDAPLMPRKTVWELIESNTKAPKHTGFLERMSRMVFDPNVATQTGIHPITGQPVYDIASGMVWQNPFIDHVADLINEDSVYTAFLLTDDVYQMQYDRFNRFYNSGNNVAKSDSLTHWGICKDLVFPGSIPPDQLNGYLVSHFGVKVPVNSSAIVETHKASNGVLYVINTCDIPVQDKILPIVIEAEDTMKLVTWATGGRSGYTRQKLLASGGFDFVLYNHLANPGIIRYVVYDVNSVKYKFYWVAVNDFNYNFGSVATADTLKQSLGEALILTMTPKSITFGSPIPISNGLVNVLDKSYETAGRVHVGDLEYVRYKDWMMLQVTGSGKNTPIAFDYIIMMPVFD